MVCLRLAATFKMHWNKILVAGLLCASPCFAAGAADAEKAPYADADKADAYQGQAEQPAFQLNELRVLGNTLLPSLTIAKLLYPYLGPARTFADVEAARAALEGEYHAQGFGTVYIDIPEQTVGRDGVIRLHVTETQLQPTRIKGTRYFSNRQIREALPAAVSGTSPNLPQLQAQITTLNTVTTDRVVTPVLKAGTEPGTVALELQVQDKLPLHAVVELNNQYTADTKPLRASLGLSYDNAFARQDSFSLQYQTSLQDTQQVRVYAASYLLRLPDSDKLSFSFIDSSSQVATVGDINVVGKGKTYGAQFLHSLETSTAVISSVQAGLTYHDSTQDVLLGAANGLSSPISYSSLQFGYSWLRQGEQRIWTWNNNLVLGIPGLGGSRTDFANKCFGCKPGFSIWRTDASAAQKLPANLSMVVRLAGQYSVDPVISNEQSLLGGAHSVRGYLEAEELGDVGVHASLELHANSLLPNKWFLQLQPYLFYDWGRVSFQQPLPGQQRSASLRSAGIGMDLTWGTHVSGSLLYGDPLIDASHTKKGDGRYEFVIRGTW
jgi:hemolysin activation/secretion protein